MTHPLPSAVRALAEADFGEVARRFEEAGLKVALPAKGIMTLRSGTADAARASVLLSVGVHGDETGPIEMVAYVLEALSREPGALGVDLMLCVGNIDAISQGRRFIDADLNRMFRKERGSLAGTAEAARADTLISVTTEFFAGAGTRRWHLDLHTAIRPSYYPAFAIVPDLVVGDRRAELVEWMGAAAIGAIIMNPSSAGTYSYYSAEHHGAAGATVELGRIGTLGHNDLAQFAHAQAALDALLRGHPLGQPHAQPHVFKVAQNIIKLSDDFVMNFGRETQNFTSAPFGTVIATDGETTYTVEHDQEMIVFPNPDVRVGLRAGMMVVRVA